MNNILVRALLLSLIILFLFVANIKDPRSELRVSFLNVGQGDSSLIQTRTGKNILIDGGPNDEVVYQLSKELPWWDRTIDLLILTHPHADHVGGLIEVLERYEVKKILYTGVPHGSPTYIYWLKVVRESNIPVVIIDRQQKIDLLDDCFLEVLYPLESVLNLDVSSLNNTSMVVRLSYGENSFLFTGDIEEEAEMELLESGVDLKADVLKLAHHGSDTSTSLEFLRAVRPDMVVIQAGKNNKFNHPSPRVLKRLERMNVGIFRNDLSGTIRFGGNGKEIVVK